MKHIVLWIMGCLFCGVVNAQEQQLFDEYLREAGLGIVVLTELDPSG